MSEEYSAGYQEGYQDGWNAAIDTPHPHPDDTVPATDVALLRQALEQLENSRSLEPVDVDWVKGKREATIAALKERLK